VLENNRPTTTKHCCFSCDWYSCSCCHQRNDPGMLLVQRPCKAAQCCCQGLDASISLCPHEMAVRELSTGLVNAGRGVLSNGVAGLVILSNSTPEVDDLQQVCLKKSAGQVWMQLNACSPCRTTGTIKPISRPATVAVLSILLCCGRENYQNIAADLLRCALGGPVESC